VADPGGILQSLSSARPLAAMSASETETGEGFVVTPEQQAHYVANLAKIVKLQANWKGK